MPTLYLHIGQNKAGSSALQRFLRQNVDLLEQCGVTYPNPDGGAHREKEVIDSGEHIFSIMNIAIGQNWRQEMTHHTQLYLQKNLLFSNEFLYDHIIKKGANFEEFLSDLPATFDVKIILYIRDIIDHFLSRYQQRVKLGLFHGSIEDSFSSYVNPCLVLKCIQLLTSLGLDLTIRKYRSAGLIEDFTRWLFPQRWDDFLAEASFDDMRVNRSLTPAEIALLRSFGRFLPRKDRLIKDIGRSLVGKLPHLKGPGLFMSQDLADKLKEKFTDTVAEINSFVGPDDQLSTDFRAPEGPANRSVDGEYMLNERQLEVVARVIAEAIQGLRAGQKSEKEKTQEPREQEP